jgi:hypothetical protein
MRLYTNKKIIFGGKELSDLQSLKNLLLRDSFSLYQNEEVNGERKYGTRDRGGSNT